MDPKSASNVPLPMENARPLVKEAPDLAWRFSFHRKDAVPKLKI